MTTSSEKVDDTEAGPGDDTGNDVAVDAHAEAVAFAARAVSDPNRIAILKALRDRERCVRDLVEACGQSQPLVSHHLRVLAVAGLIGSRRHDGFTLYSVDTAGLTTALTRFIELLDPASLGAEALPGGNSACCRPA